ncbi:inositol monophosphatase family protein [Actinomadura macra]|uniref:inositol monophosphatase family protein n=1 Tax=Actinomadura macra TaxID=46164 RepID=UPI000A00BBB1|nr:inositol monophosphatase family protein [Actinomadura macra]
MSSHLDDRTTPTLGGRNPVLDDDRPLMAEVAAVVRAAGRRMIDRFTSTPRLTDRDEVVTAIHANDDASLEILRPGLDRLRPDAGWVDDELEGGALPDGEWWVTDPVEGNINHVHGMSDWGVTATLVRDNIPVVTVVHLPLTGDTYTAVQGGGAFQNETRLSHSQKKALDGALVGTGQAKPGESPEAFRRIGASATAMLREAMVIRVSVPATLQLIQVAAGRMDAFWQFSQVRSGLLAGALLVVEAGGVVTDTRGGPWSLASDDFLATTPMLHAEAVRTLSTID